MSKAALGQNGCEFCSEGYAEELETRFFPRTMVSSFLQIDYAGNIRGELQDILRQIEADVAAAQGENDYLADGDGARLGEAVEELERCGLLGAFSLKQQIGQLCWYTPLDGHTIRTLQQHLNRLGFGATVKEDGVYGERTSAATRQFDFLANGRFPTVPTMAAAESVVFLADNLNTGMEVGGKLYNMTQGATGDRLLGMVRPSATPWHKMTSNGNRVYRAATRTGYRQISPRTYQMLQRFEGVGRIVHVAGRVLLVTGAALETIEMCAEINADLNDADGKIGAATGRAVGGFMGSMAGMAITVVGGSAIIGLTFASAPALILAGVGILLASPIISWGTELIGETAGEFLFSQSQGDVVNISGLTNMGG